MRPLFVTAASVVISTMVITVGMVVVAAVSKVGTGSKSGRAHGRE